MKVRVRRADLLNSMFAHQCSEVKIVNNVSLQLGNQTDDFSHDFGMPI